MINDIESCWKIKKNQGSVPPLSQFQQESSNVVNIVSNYVPPYNLTNLGLYYPSSTALWCNMSTFLTFPKKKQGWKQAKLSRAIWSINNFLKKKSTMTSSKAGKTSATSLGH